MGDFNCGVTFVALMDGHLVGWIGELIANGDDCGQTGGAVPFVLPKHRRKGIAKPLYHLAMEEAVRHGAEWGWTATEIHNPARFIYRSIGYRHWYTGYTHIELPLAKWRM